MSRLTLMRIGALLIGGALLLIWMFGNAPLEQLGLPPNAAVGVCAFLGALVVLYYIPMLRREYENERRRRESASEGDQARK